MESSPLVARPTKSRQIVLMLSPDLDGNTSNARYSLGSTEIHGLVGDVPAIQECLDSWEGVQESVTTILVSAGFGPEVFKLVSFLRRKYPQASLVACGRNLIGQILPWEPKDRLAADRFDFMIHGNSEIPVVQFLGIIGSSAEVLRTNRVPGRCRAIPLEDPVKPLPEIQHIPWTVKEAAAQVQANRQMNQRIRDRYYADRFVLVAALPKSASSVIGSCVSVIQTGNKDSRGYGSYMLKNQDSDLRPEIIRDFPEGGVVKYHTPATGKNLKVIDMLGIRYLIILRNPVDHLAAVYAHTLNSVRDNTTGSAILYEHICPLPRALFESTVPIDKAIDYLIRGGYLVHALSWVTDWLAFRNPQRSQVVRYEDFMADRKAVLTSISRFLQGRDIDEKLVAQCEKVADGYQGRRTDAIRDGAKNYPCGWTGKIGTWKDYFSPDNRKAYLSTVADFVRYYPNAGLLLQAYPDLLTPEE